MADAGHKEPIEADPLVGSDSIEGTAVRRSDGNRVGTIERLMIDRTSGRVAYAVMSFGGVLGLGEEYMTLPWTSLKYSPDLDAFALDVSDDQLRDAPRRTSRGDDPAVDRAWEEEVHRYYNATPYWGF